MKYSQHRLHRRVSASFAGALQAIILIFLASTNSVWAQDEQAAAVLPTDQKLLIEFETTTSQPPPNDPLQSLTPGEFKGKLVYIARVPVQDPKPHWQHFFVLRSFDDITGGAGTVAAYRVRVPERAFDPQFSPDGNQVLFKVGWPYDRYGSYELYLWDLRSNQVRRGPQESLTYRRVTWSPDGKYLAYVRGGDVGGNIHWEDERLELFIYSFEAKQSRMVASGRGVKSFAWTHQGTLLYSFLPEAYLPPMPNQAKNAEGQAGPAVRPDIYEVDAAGGEPRRVFTDGYHPTPSSDGKWIACFTSTDPTKNEKPATRFLEASPRQSYLCLYNREEDKRYIVRSETGSFSDLSWLPDSKRLIVMKTVDKGAEAQALISMVDVPGFTMNQIALLQAKDSQPVQWSETDPQFRLLDISNKTGETLFVLITEIVGNQGAFGDGVGHLKAITINKDLSLDIAQIKNDLGLDWYSTANPVR